MLAFKYIDQVPRPNRFNIIRNTTANGTTSLATYETEVYVYNTGSYTETITLPSVAEVAGQIFTIRSPDYGGGVTIQDRDDSLEWTDITFDADGEYTMLFSNGRQWFTLSTDVS